MLTRRCVPDNHECLFSAVALACTGSYHGLHAPYKLRQHCAEVVLADAETYCLARLGMDPIQYAEWITNPFNWGGENEILILAVKFNVEIAVVNTESMSILPYSSDNPNNQGRVYLLYTGQHYDVLVRSAGGDEDGCTDKDIRLFPVGDADSEGPALERARVEQAEKERRQKLRTVKRIKCGGCDAVLDDAEAFQAHCMEVEHDDDFAYDCSEVEVVEEADAEVPSDRIDLNSPAVHTFYNTPQATFSNLYPAAVEIEGQSYATAEHYWQCARFFAPSDGSQGTQSDDNAALVNRIKAAETADQAYTLGESSSFGTRSDWETAKVDCLRTALKCKFAQHSGLQAELVQTGDKLIVCIDNNRWAGMSAAGGIPTGHNAHGKMLMEVRGELRDAAAAGPAETP